MKDNDHVSLSILGAAQSSERMLALPNVNSYPVLAYDAMLDFFAKHDILIVPLTNNIFNNAKSSVKWVEAAAAGLVVVASPVKEFEAVIEHNKTGFLLDNDKISFEFLSEIKYLELNEMVEECQIKLREKYSTNSLS